MILTSLVAFCTTCRISCRTKAFECFLYLKMVFFTGKKALVFA